MSKIAEFRAHLPFLSLLVFTPLFFLHCSSQEESANPTLTISVSEFGAIANDGQNDLPALRKALDACREKKGITLHFPPGRYDIRDEGAVKLMESVMSGQMGNNPEKAIFRPYFEYVRGLDFTSMESITVEAYGAEMIIDGWMEPVSLEDCRNIAIEGLTIDYKRAPYSIGTIIDIKDEYFDVQFDPKYPISQSMPIPRVTIWDTEADRMMGECLYPESNQVIGDQTLRVFAPAPAAALGELALCNHSFHFRPAILIHEAEDIKLEKVTIHSQPGMGIVGHRSKNLTFQNLRVIPRAGSRMSTNTDATHFTSCSGFIHFEGCQFEGQGDDSTNIHNYYYSFLSQEPRAHLAGANTYEITLEAPTGTHAQVLDYPDPGDRLEVVEIETLRAVDEVTVTEIRNDPQNWRSWVALDHPLQVPLEDHYLINVSRLPKVRIINCQIRSHRARAILIKTRDVLIEGCTIQDTTGTAIHVGAEGWWHEGPASADVRIRFNRILDCGFGEGTQNHSSGISVNVKADRADVPGVHKRILVEGNQIRVPRGTRHGIFVGGSENVTIRFNQITGAEVPIEIQHSEQVYG